MLDLNMTNNYFALELLMPRASYICTPLPSKQCLFILISLYIYLTLSTDINIILLL